MESSNLTALLSWRTFTGTEENTHDYFLSLQVSFADFSLRRSERKLHLSPFSDLCLWIRDWNMVFHIFITEVIGRLNLSLVIISAVALKCSAGNSLPVQRQSGVLGHSKDWVDSPAGERLCPCKEFSGLRTDKLSHWRRGVCLHTHRASRRLGDFCQPAVNHYPSRAVLSEISALFCSPEGVYCRQHSLGRCLHCVLTGSQLAPAQSPDREPCTAAHLYFLGKGSNSCFHRPRGAGSARDTGWGGSGQVNSPWVLMRSCGCAICARTWIQDWKAVRLEGMVQGEALPWVNYAKHKKSPNPQILQDSCTQKRFLPQVFK